MGTTELDLKEVFSALIRRLWLIVLCAALAGGLMLIYTVAFVTPQYQASISVYVNNTANGGQGGISSSDLATSQKLVATYINILKSDTVLDRVVASVDGDATAKEIREMIDSEAMGTTEVFQVKVTNEDPALAAQIANAIAEIAPKEIANIVEGSSARIVDYAKVPEEPHSPSVMKNTVLGAFVGILAAMAAIVLMVLLDVRVKSEADLRRLSDAPVLGVIPDYDMDYKKGGYSSDNASADGINDKEM
jgi:capsular polysaccharide biosynthesis protein